VASLGLVSAGAVNDSVTLFFLKKVTTFLVIVTTPTLFAFQVIVSSVFFVNSAAKILDFHQGDTPWMVSPGAVGPLPPPSDVAGLYTIMTDLATGNTSKYTAQLPQ